MTQYVFFILGFCLLIFTGGFAQTPAQETLEEKLLTQDASDQDIVLHGRHLILEQLNANNTDGMYETIRFLYKHITDKNNLIFYPEEWILLMYWTEEYKTLLNNIITLHLSSSPYDYDEMTILPPEDNFYFHLKSKSANSLGYLLEGVNLTKLDDEDKDFLSLLLQNILYQENTANIDQQELSFQGRDFLRTYPNSIYHPIIVDNFLLPQQETDWGVGIGLHLGSIYTGGTMSRYMDPTFSIGFNFTGSYKRWYAYGWLTIGTATRLKKSFIDSNEKTWPADIKFSTFTPELIVGYALLDNQNFRLTPYVGLSGYSLAVTEKEVDKNPDYDLDYWIGLNYNAGLILDYKFPSNITEETASFTSMQEPNGELLMQIRVGVSSPTVFNPNAHRFSGSLVYISCGIGGFARAVKRYM